MRIALGVVLGTVVAAGCSGSGQCTEATCEHEAVVTYPAALLTGPYDLTLSFPGLPTLTSRCADPGAPELADNPEGVTCDLAGFQLSGDIAGQRTVSVQLVDVALDEVIVAGSEVRLEAVGESRPNGPDCDPVCFVRNGSLDAVAEQ